MKGADMKFKTFFETKIGWRSKSETKVAPAAPTEEAPKSKGVAPEKQPEHKPSPNLTKGVKA